MQTKSNYRFFYKIHYKFILLLICILLLIFILILNDIKAQNYYANVEIEIKENGKIDISGSSNHPLLNEIYNSDNYTSKNKEIWTLNMTLNDSFNQYIAEIKFPNHAILKYLKAANVLAIKEEDNRIIVIITGNNEIFFIYAQYLIENKQNFEKNFLIYIPVILISITIIVTFLFRKSKYNKEIYKRDNNIKENNNLENLKIKSLTDRQKKIYELVKKSKDGIKQSELEKILKIPKASLSRNIASLERKRLIIKLEKGMSNLIVLNKDYLEKLENSENYNI